MTRKIRCSWCGEYFIVESVREQNAVKYCSTDCREEARRENVRKAVEKYRKTRRDERGYRLGESCINEHHNQNFTAEMRIVQKEKRRLGL